MAISRRRFLGLAAGLVPALQGGDPVNRIVVVGAGLAGLHAADLLRKNGREVVVLEARDRPGGRVLTIHAPFDEGLYGEAGAIRIAAVHKRVLQLAREHRLTLVPFESPNGAAVVRVGGSSVRADEVDRIAPPLDLRQDERGATAAALLDRYVGTLSFDSLRSFKEDAQTWPEWLRARGASPAAVRLMTLGGDSTELSALYVLRQIALLGTTTRFFKIRGGMDLLPRAIAASLGSAVRYRAEVVRIDRTARTLRVDYVENGAVKRVDAGDVILAIPFSTLRQIEVRPPFDSSKARLVQTLEYFPSCRFLLQSSARVWQDAGLSGAARTDRPAELWDAAYDLPATRGLLGCTVGGALGRALGKMSEDACLKVGRDMAAEAFPRIGLNFEKGVVYRWALEPWSRGGFAVFRPGQMTSPAIGQPDGRVHFAGEHTSAWTGWMEGALESAERVVQEVLKK